MPASTKKLGPAGRLGARYGSLARKQIATMERQQRKYHACPTCGQLKVKRVSTGIWGCRKCGYEFAGGAYLPATGAGMGAKKTLRGITDKLVRAEADDQAFQALRAEE